MIKEVVTKNKMSVLVFVGFFFLIPAMFLFVGLENMQKMYEANALADIGSEIREHFITAKTLEVDPACFWAQTFFSIKTEVERAGDAAKTAASWRSYYDNAFEYIVWPSDGSEPIFSSDAIKHGHDWKRLWDLVYFVCSIATQDSMNSVDRQPKISPDSWRFLQSFFGPHISINKIQRGMNSSNRLIWSDYAKDSPIWWGFFSNDKKNRGFFRLNRENYEDQGFLENYFTRIVTEGQLFRFRYLHGDKPADVPADLARKIVEFVTLPDNMGQQHFAWQGNYYFPKKFADNIFFAVVSRDNLLKGFVIEPIWAVVIFGLSFLPVFWSFLRLLDEGQRAFLSISRKIAFLFVYAAGLPLLILGFCAVDYLEKKQNSLIEAAGRQGLDCVRQFDRNLKVYVTRKNIHVDDVVGRFKKLFRERGATFSLFQELQKELIGKGRFSRLNQVFLVAPAGFVFDKYGKISGGKYEFTVSDPPYDELVFKMGVIGRGFARLYTNQALVGKEATELELIFNTLFSKSPEHIFNIILESLEDIFMFGWGTEEFPSYCSFLALHPENQLVLHFLFVLWPENMLQLEYIDEQILNANKNADSFKLVAIANSYDAHTFPESLSVDGILEDFSSKISATKGYLQDDVVLKGQRYLAGGFKGVNLSFFNLIYLYPYEKIASEIYQEKFELLTTVLVVLLLTFLSGLLLVKVFLVPIISITAGVRAIERREFTYKVEHLSDDEFGALTKILNKTIADLEELNIASIVQKKLFPRPGFSPGHFGVFAKTISLGDLGGDYYDYFKTSENGFAMLLGDVAGHGVGAALIMAMAKAGTIYLGSKLDQPGECLGQLHKLIKSVKSKKQKKFMTLQYMAVDSLSGRILYSNAGGCDPLIYRKSTQTIEEVRIVGSALGMFEKTKFSEEILQLEPGDAIILYTDGIIEAADVGGEVLGYDRFKEMVRKSYDLNAEKFCNGVFTRYHEHLGSGSPSDDISILLAVFNPEQKNI